MADQFVEQVEMESVATLTLDRPPLNMLNIEMMEQINAAILGLRGRTDIKVLVIRGKGEAFCGGVDLSDRTKEKVSRMLHVFHRIFESMRLLDVITVAAVDGVASGAGFELALGCNLVMASEGARFALPQVKFGHFPALACVVLPRAAPRRKAMEWILTGEEIAAEELRSFGLVNRVFSAEGFEAGLADFLCTLTSKSGPVLSLAKRAQIESYYAAYEEALYKSENLYLRDLLALEDAREGIQAFIEKRAPKWRDA